MRFISIPLLIAASALLAGCATPGTSQPYADVPAPYCANVDCQTMSDVDRVALSRGVRVIWVHPPEKLAGAHNAAPGS
jgi:hypothetical protein